MGYIRHLNRSGDTAVEWDVEKPETVEKARQTFQQFLDSGFAMFAVSPSAPTTQIRKFDPALETIGVVKPFVGG